MIILDDANLGPLICLFLFDADEEAVALANGTDFSLCAAVFS